MAKGAEGKDGGGKKGGRYHDDGGGGGGGTKTKEEERCAREKSRWRYIDVEKARMK